MSFNLIPIFELKINNTFNSIVVDEIFLAPNALSRGPVSILSLKISNDLFGDGGCTLSFLGSGCNHNRFPKKFNFLRIFPNKIESMSLSGKPGAKTSWLTWLKHSTIPPGGSDKLFIDQRSLTLSIYVTQRPQCDKLFISCQNRIQNTCYNGWVTINFFQLTIGVLYEVL